MKISLPYSSQHETNLGKAYPKIKTTEGYDETRNSKRLLSEATAEG